MIAPFFVGIFVAIVVSKIPKVVKLRNLALHTDVSQEIKEWARLEGKSFQWLAGVVVFVVIISVFGMLCARGFYGTGELELAINVASVFALVEAFLLAIGLAAATVLGLRARRVLQTADIKSPVSVSLAAKVILFVLGWMTYLGLVFFLTDG